MNDDRQRILSEDVSLLEGRDGPLSGERLPIRGQSDYDSQRSSHCWRNFWQQWHLRLTQIAILGIVGFLVVAADFVYFLSWRFQKATAETESYVKEQQDAGDSLERAARTAFTAAELDIVRQRALAELVEINEEQRKLAMEAAAEAAAFEERISKGIFWSNLKEYLQARGLVRGRR